MATPKEVRFSDDARQRMLKGQNLRLFTLRTQNNRTNFGCVIFGCALLCFCGHYPHRLPLTLSGSRQPQPSSYSPRSTHVS